MLCADCLLCTRAIAQSSFGGRGHPLPLRRLGQSILRAFGQSELFFGTFGPSLDHLLRRLYKRRTAPFKGAPGAPSLEPSGVAVCGQGRAGERERRDRAGGGGPGGYGGPTAASKGSAKKGAAVVM